MPDVRVSSTNSSYPETNPKISHNNKQLQQIMHGSLIRDGAEAGRPCFDGKGLLWAALPNMSGSYMC